MKNIEIILNSDAEERELEDIKKLTSNFGLNNIIISANGTRRHVGADLPPELVIIISFVAGALISGFFNAIGSDLWEKIKQFLKEGADYYEKQNGGQEIYNADIILDIREENKTLFKIVIKKSNASKIDNVFEIFRK